MTVSRRTFIQSAGFSLAGLSMKTEPKISGSFVNESFQQGHMLRDRAAFSSPKRIEKTSVVIVGGPTVV